MSKGGGIVTEPGSDAGIHLTNYNAQFAHTNISSDEQDKFISSAKFGYEGQNFVNLYSINNNTIQYLQSLTLSTQNESAGGTGQTDYVFQVSNLKYSENPENIAGGSITIRSDTEASESSIENYPIGISFVDTTIDPSNPNKIYKLSDFALKSDIPAGVDLTNYQGSISATNEFSNSSIVGTSTLKLNEAFSYTSQFTQPLFNNTVMKSTFSSTRMDMGCAVYIPQNDNNGVYYSVDTSTDLSGHYQIHTQYSSNGGATSINDPGNTGKYNLLIGGDNHFGLQFSYTNMSNESTPKLLVIPADGFYISGTRCAIGEADIIQQDNISSSTGIWFKDTTIQSDAFTLKSITDRISSLETSSSDVDLTNYVGTVSLKEEFDDSNGSTATSAFTINNAEIANSISFAGTYPSNLTSKRQQGIMSSKLREGIIYSGKSFNSSSLEGAGKLTSLDINWLNYNTLQISIGENQTATSVSDTVNDKIYYSFGDFFTIKDTTANTNTRGFALDLPKYFRLESSTNSFTYALGGGKDYYGNGLDGIYFQDSTIQSDAFTLKSLVDRIVQLETAVTQLQSQLTNKANTANPIFTGKVSINS